MVALTAFVWGDGWAYLSRAPKLVKGWVKELEIE
jgi:hypothetical protein